MKILLFCLLLSFVLHLLALSSLSLSTSSSQPEIGEVMDLTVVSPAATVAPATKSASAQASPPRPEALTNPGSASAASPERVSEKSSAQESAENGNNVGDDSTPVVGWSEITRLPKVKREVKAQYPAEAKSAGVDGPVLLEILIDREGQVRQVKVLSGPGYGLNESAVAALKSFEFQPAFKGKESVAVKIRYTYRFKLEVN